MPESALQSEAAFISGIVEKMEKAEAAAPVVEATPIAAAVVEEKKPDAPAVPTDRPAAPDPSDAAPVVEAAAAPPADQLTPGETVDDELTEEEETALDAEFVAAAGAHKLPTSVDDLPEEARPLVAKRLKEMEAGLTRALQDARSYRQEEVKFRAEERFRTEHTPQFIVEMLKKDPTLGAKVNDLLTEMEAGPTSAKALEVVVKDLRADAARKTTDELAAQHQRNDRGIALHVYAVKAAEKAGVPFKLGVEEAVVAAILADPNREITEAQIDEIAKEKAATYQRHIRANRRAASADAVKTKVAVAKTGLVVKPGTGASPAPVAKAKPKNDAEFIESFASRMA